MVSTSGVFRMIKFFFFALSASLTFASARADDDRSPPAWQWSIETIEAHVNRIRAGQDLQPESWPDGNRIAVLFSFDVDNETNTLSRGGNPDPLLLSMEQYGAREGLRRVLELLDHHRIPATFFIPGVSLHLAPEMAAMIQRSDRHEFAVHGWIHESVAGLTRDQEKGIIEKSRDFLERRTGQRPVGYRAPFGTYTGNTLSILTELGFLYDSGLAADDSPHALIVNGKPSPLIELPPNVNFEDSVLDPMNTFTAGLVAPEVMLQSFMDGFDVLYRERTMMLLILHPHISGRPSRIGIFDALIRYMKEHEGVWFATHRQAAEYVNASRK